MDRPLLAVRIFILYPAINKHKTKALTKSIAEQQATNIENTIKLFRKQLSTLTNSRQIVESLTSNDLDSLNTLKFNFTQKSFDKEEKGICYLKRPDYLKCFYEDKNQKELIISKRILVIYHKRYNKIYRYPLSKSFFLEILNRDKFAKIIREGDLNQENNVLEIKYIDQDKGEIDF